MGDSGAVCPYQDGRSRRLASVVRDENKSKSIVHGCAGRRRIVQADEGGAVEISWCGR